jgi:hypothetical protein
MWFVVVRASDGVEPHRFVLAFIELAPVVGQVDVLELGPALLALCHKSVLQVHDASVLLTLANTITKGKLFDCVYPWIIGNGLHPAAVKVGEGLPLATVR